MLYAARTRRTGHRLAALDVPTPSWMRAPGETPGVYALECAMDELALAAGIDPIELRARNEPELDPETGLAFSSRGLLECMRVGAERFGWADRDPTPGVRRDGRWLVGTGRRLLDLPGPPRAVDGVRPRARGRHVRRRHRRGGHRHRRAHRADPDRRRCARGPARPRPRRHRRQRPADRRCSRAARWARRRGARRSSRRSPRCARTSTPTTARCPTGGLEARAGTADDIKAQEPFARHAFGAQFCEVRRERGHRRGARAPDARRVRVRADPQPAHRRARSSSAA